MAIAPTTAVVALDTTAVASIPVLAEVEPLLKALAAKLATLLPAADLTLLQAFVSDLAAQANSDPTAAKKLRDDANAAISRARRWVGTELENLGKSLDQRTDE